MRGRHPHRHHFRNDVLAEIVLRCLVAHVLVEQVEQERRVEHVDAHAGERDVGFARHRRRIGGLLDEFEDLVRPIDCHDAERDRLQPRHLDARDGALRAALDVRLEHQRIVLLVDVVARQHDDVRRMMVADDVDVLVDRVRGATIPVLLVDPLLRRQELDELVHLPAEEAPALLQVTQQAVRLVLGDDTDPADAGVETVRQREVDDPELAAEIHGRLCAPRGKVLESRSAPAREHQRDGATWQLRSSDPFVCHRSAPVCLVVRDRHNPESHTDFPAHRNDAASAKLGIVATSHRSAGTGHSCIVHRFALKLQT